MRVMIAEGLEPVRTRLMAMVREQPGMCVIGTNADMETTVDGIRSNSPDVVILGSRLTDGTGFQVLRSLAGQARNIAIILLCQQLDGDYLYSGHALGADFVLETPRDLDLVPSLLNKLLEDRRRAPGGAL